MIPDEYVRARSVLLDALQALEPHLDSLTLVGAQAVYLQTGDADLAAARPPLTPTSHSIPRGWPKAQTLKRAFEPTSSSWRSNPVLGEGRTAWRST